MLTVLIITVAALLIMYPEKKPAYQNIPVRSRKF